MVESYGVHFNGVVYGPFGSDEAAKAWADRQVFLAEAGNPSALGSHEWAIVRIVAPRWDEN